MLKVPFFRPGTDDEIVIRELVEQDMYRMSALASLLGPNPSGVIIDGGAHIGVATTLFAEYFPHTPVFAYEPEVGNFELLRANTATFANVNICNAALGTETEARVGDVPLWSHGDVACTGRFSTVRCEQNSPSDTCARVRVVSLASLLARVTPVLVLKLDLEGGEGKLLNELPLCALEQVEVLILEMHPWVRPLVDTARLEKAGFELLFHPYDDPRHGVYKRKREANDRI